jgi:hypothetical protein
MNYTIIIETSNKPKHHLINITKKTEIDDAYINWKTNYEYLNNGNIIQAFVIKNDDNGKSSIYKYYK